MKQQAEDKTKEKPVKVTSYTRMINGIEVWVKPHRRNSPPKRRRKNRS